MSTDEKIVEAFKVHEHFCKSMLDAYALVNLDGKVIKCNQLLSAMLGTKPRQILKATGLDALISLQLTDKPLSISELLQHQAPTRVDEVRGTILAAGSDDTPREDLNLIIGLYPFLDDGKVVGAFLLIRDVTAETNLQGKYRDKATQSITDKLTGLYNRTYFDSYLPSLLKSSRDLKALSIIMADIDHFKSINDNYGHQAGDYILEKVSGQFKAKFRKTDVVCRYGGEEFLAILPSTDIVGATNAAQKLRQAVESDTYEFNGQSISVTISLGIAEAELGVESGDQVIARADSALYHSKSTGRNRVSLHLGNAGIEPADREDEKDAAS